MRSTSAVPEGDPRVFGVLISMGADGISATEALYTARSQLHEWILDGAVEGATAIRSTVCACLWGG